MYKGNACGGRGEMGHTERRSLRGVECREGASVVNARDCVSVRLEMSIGWLGTKRVVVIWREVCCAMRARRKRDEAVGQNM